VDILHTGMYKGTHAYTRPQDDALSALISPGRRQKTSAQLGAFPQTVRANIVPCKLCTETGLQLCSAQPSLAQPGYIHVCTCGANKQSNKAVALVGMQKRTEILHGPHTHTPTVRKDTTSRQYRNRAATRRTPGFSSSRNQHSRTGIHAGIEDD
jgi:hypothetical protein